MGMTTCPHCGASIESEATDNCPACGQPQVVTLTAADQVADNASDSLRPAAIVKRMTTGEQIYTACVILCIGFFLLGLASFHFVIIPGSDNPRVLYFVVAILWMFVISLAATTIANLYYRTLVTIATFIQCVTLAAAIYFIPLAIWGGVLLYRRLRDVKKLSV